MSSQFEPPSHQPMPTIGGMDSHPRKPPGAAQYGGRPDNQQLADYLECIAAGDRALFEALYQLTASRLWAVVRRMVVHKQSAEDVLQEAYLTIWRKAHLFDRTAGEALGWMTTIARHGAIAWLRQPDNATRIACSVPAPHGDLEAIAADAPEPSVLFNELLDKLSWEQRESLLLVYLYGLTQEEVSVTLNVPLGTIKSRVRRGLIALKDLLDS
jgi:RNA polymerase sigma-70 factor, ECF subfamily